MKNCIMVFMAEGVSLREPSVHMQSLNNLSNSDHSILMSISQCKNSSKTHTQNLTTVNSEPCWRPLMCLLTSAKRSRQRHYSSVSTSSCVLPAIKPNWLYMVKQCKNHSSLAISFPVFHHSMFLCSLLSLHFLVSYSPLVVYSQYIISALTLV